MNNQAKIIIFGGRDFNDYNFLKTEVSNYINENLDDDIKIEIVSGRCDRGTLTFTTKDGIDVYGADGLGEKFAEDFSIPVKPFPADWNKFGWSAGPIRNTEMADYGTHAIGFWDGESRGTSDMIKKTKKLKAKFCMYA